MRVLPMSRDDMIQLSRMRVRNAFTALLSATLVLGCSIGACTAFGSNDKETSTGADGGGSAAPSQPGDGLVVCQSEAGTPCQLPAEVCCLSYSDPHTPDLCIPRPTAVNGPCPGLGPQSRIAECDDSDDCASPNICCALLLGSALPSFLCVSPASCIQTAMPVCNISKNDCPDGHPCTLVGPGVYTACQ